MSAAFTTRTTIPSQPLRFSGRWLVAARVVWCVLVGYLVLIFLLGIAPSFEILRVACDPNACNADSWLQLLPQQAQALAASGFSLNHYAAYMTGLEVFQAVIFAACGLLIFTRRSDEGIAFVASLAVVVLGVYILPGTPGAVFVAHPWLRPLQRATFIWGNWIFPALLFLLPDGRFVPRWGRWFFILWGGLVTYNILTTDINAPPVDGVIERLVSVVILLSAGVSVYGQIYRYRRVATPLQRQQIKWLGLGLLGIAAGTLVGVLFNPFPTSLGDTPIEVRLLATTLIALGFSSFPIALTFAILRHRLWDIDLVLNRTLVYGGLTAAIVALYALIVGGLSALFHTQLSPVIAYISVGLAALLFQPLRERLQRAVNRLMFGQRDEPYAVLARFGRQLETTPALDTLLPTITATIKDTLKLPIVEIEVNSGPTLISSITNHQFLITFPLLYQNEPVGRLVVAPREGETGLSTNDRRLLEDLARQAGVAVHAARVTAELQNARERLVTAREEERRRLRRDLHDGLGPKLAGQALILEAVRDSLEPNAQNRMLVEHLIEDSQTIVVEVRELVHGLRPPALDEFGLVSALRTLAAQCESGGLHVTVTAPEPLPPLPAAVEVAAYRIVQEALTNVVKHARATACTVSLTINEDLRLAVEDDGVGLAPARRAGVGLLSMRERAEEIGGRCVIERGGQGGTRVTVRLPRSG